MPDAPIFQCLNDPAISYIESSYVESSLRPEGQAATRHLQINGADQERFEQAMLGYSVYERDFGILMRFPPEHHPRKPWLFARTCEFVRELAEPAIIPEVDVPPDRLELALTLQYERIEMAVTYEATPGIRWLGDEQIPDGVDHEAWRYVEAHKLDWDIENRIIPKNRLFFDTVQPPKLLVPDPGVQLVPSATFWVMWFQVPAVVDDKGIPQLPGNLQAKHANCQGRINSLPFLGYAPLTLYCQAPKRELVTMSNGELAWNFTFQFLQRGFSDYSTPVLILGDATVGGNLAETDGPNWCRLINPKNGKYLRVYREVDGVPADRSKSIYDRADLYDLFRPAAAELFVG